MKTTGVVIVNYNTPNIITRAVESVRMHVDRVLIIDNSDHTNDAYKECDRLAMGNVDVYHTYCNLGHGLGLNRGIDLIGTDYVICMDSDAELIDPTLLPEMRAILTNEKNYGCGLVVTTNENGINSDKGIDYLHPYFCMFKRSVFNMYSPFINHGAPFIRTMIEIQNKLEVFGVYEITTRCKHEGRATRKVAGSNWLKGWDKI